MSLITLIFPAGVQSVSDSRGNVVTADVTGRAIVDPSVVVLSDLIAVGLAQAPDIASATRPTVTYPGQPYFDTTLASGVGRPIWRNATNSGWVDSTGASV